MATKVRLSYAAAAAEIARQGRWAGMYRRLAEAQLGGRVEWFRRNCYDAGLVDKLDPDGGIVAVVWHGKDCGQRPSVTVWETGEVRSWVEQLRREQHMKQDVEQDQRELLEVLAEVLEAVP